jgi:hypothetical protein
MVNDLLPLSCHPEPLAAFSSAPFREKPRQRRHRLTDRSRFVSKMAEAAKRRF